jgi:D-alanyl-lipoteichoic acid acyltransferase DltB (MBOAT superfamily)
MLQQFIKDVFVFNSESPLLFTQFYFWAFFALVYACFSLLNSRIVMRNAFLAAAGVFFYYKTSGLFIILLLFTIFFNYFIAKKIEAKCKTNDSGGTFGSTAFLVIGITVNLLTLCYYKYAYFLSDLVNNLLGTDFRVFDSFAAIGNMLTGSQRFDAGNILLPVGISFFTFQNISYIVDVYRRRVATVSRISDYAFYVSFFPQLVAGPIVRANDFIPQIYKKFFLSRRQFGIAVFWIVNGLAKKIILSDYIAVNFVDRVFDSPTMFSGFENLAALFGYSLQVYADFSGYTDIAIGVAMLFGFYLPVNFNSPYKATNAANFWKRWHISLSRWLQDYLYIPLGGNRNATVGTYACIISIALIAMILAGNIIISVIIILVGAAIFAVARLQPERRKKITTNLNNMDTMLLGGLWHGASWNFVIWGGLNGLGILIYKFWKDKSENCRLVLLGLLAAILAAFVLIFRKPVFNIGLVWVAVLFAVTALKFVLAKRKAQRRKNVEAEKGIMLSAMLASTLTSAKEPIANAWAVAQTFVFITFTRLFFRAGSNLDPAEANHEAWSTATGMVNRIGSQWDFSLICPMISSYSGVFSLIVAGMIIHWLPERWKRRYRLWFAGLPLAVMAVVVVVIVFIVYQFVTADLQKFIYFQF